MSETMGCAGDLAKAYELLDRWTRWVLHKCGNQAEGMEIARELNELWWKGFRAQMKVRSMEKEVCSLNERINMLEEEIEELRGWKCGTFGDDPLPASHGFDPGVEPMPPAVAASRGASE